MRHAVLYHSKLGITELRTVGLHVSFSGTLILPMKKRGRYPVGNQYRNGSLPTGLVARKRQGDWWGYVYPMGACLQPKGDTKRFGLMSAPTSLSVLVQ